MATRQIKNVAIAGASGDLGTHVLNALLAAKFTVTALVRPDSTSNFPSSVQLATVDYNLPQTLQSALQGQDALVCTLGYAGMLSQIPLIDAAVAAGVHRIIPSEYGSDPRDAEARALPVFGWKVQVEQHLQAAVKGHPETSYTQICNNEFFDWDLDHAFGVDIKGKKLEIFDGGDRPFTATPLHLVAQGVVGVLRDPEATANRVIRIHGTSMTQNKLLSLLKRFTGEEGWDVAHASTIERVQQAYQVLQTTPNDFAKWAVMFLQAAVWGGRFQNDFLGSNDNELVGVKELTEEEIVEIVRKRC